MTEQTQSQRHFGKAVLVTILGIGALVLPGGAQGGLVEEVTLGG